MKKSSILLCIMSIVSFLIAALGIIGIALAVILSHNLAETQNNNELTTIIGVFIYIGIFALFIAALLTVAITLLPGILGLICSLKNGKFATGCLIIGSIGSFCSLSSFINTVIQKESIIIPLLSILYFGLYTAGAGIVYADKKSRKKMHEYE